jgi:hypothetical protein
MWPCYLIALLPAVIWGPFFYKDRRLVWWEWLGASLIGLVLSVLLHFAAISGMTGDTETWSGMIGTAAHHPEWVEKYQVAIYRTETRHRTVYETDSQGRSRSHIETYTEEVFDHYEDRYRTHPQYWDCLDTIGCTREISATLFEEIRKNFKHLEATKPGKSGFYSGDPHVYVSVNKSGFIYPTTDPRSFENRIKAAPSVFSYTKVSTNIPVFKYPENKNWRTSDRLLGTAANKFSILEWDRLNARLGASKKVNLIAVGFDASDAILGHYQEAAWIGGKKNDLVIVFGGQSTVNLGYRPSWVRVFGWTEQEIVKRNLETIFLRNAVTDSLLPIIEAEVRANYQLKDWSKFDYITITPPGWAYVLITLVVLCAQAGMLWWSKNNEFDRG